MSNLWESKDLLSTLDIVPTQWNHLQIPLGKNLSYFRKKKQDWFFKKWVKISDETVTEDGNQMWELWSILLAAEVVLQLEVFWKWEFIMSRPQYRSQFFNMVVITVQTCDANIGWF